MASNTMVRRHTQARGRARRELLLNAARTLLNERDMSEITLPAVAELADIPTSSAYHFFPDMLELYKELARAFSNEMTGAEGPPPTVWQDVIRDNFDAQRTFFNTDPAARQLLLGSKVPPELRHSACYDDDRFGQELYDLLASHFAMPLMIAPSKTFLRAILIADTFYGMSVTEHGIVTDEAFEESVRAANAYLGLYLPPILLPRSAAETQLRAVDTDAALGNDAWVPQPVAYAIR